MKFDGHLLRRGFWLYIWRITGPSSDHVYIGRTGDSSSPHASSPFKRIGQHLEMKANAKGNALGKQLPRAGVVCEDCVFEMTAIGPIHPEAATFEAHVPLRDATAALERAVADWLKERRYQVLGTHPRKGEPDAEKLRRIIGKLDRKFPVIAAEEIRRTRAGHG